MSQKEQVERARAPRERERGEPGNSSLLHVSDDLQYNLGLSLHFTEALC